ncbi:hypothetical protein Pve01_90210 [Planomonospora venezuelensis]|nr:hypothetical protein Pve01_90210 [Planomonospora venezuelensis]
MTPRGVRRATAHVSPGTFVAPLEVTGKMHVPDHSGSRAAAEAESTAGATRIQLGGTSLF